MNISRVWAKDLYGGINFDVTLKAGINLLVGINGSGKTSLLNIINWLTARDFAELGVTQFKEVGIEFASPTSKLTALICTQKGLDMYVRGKGLEAKAIHVRLPELPSAFAQSSIKIKANRGRLENLTPEDHELPLWNAVDELVEPLTILLDRRLAIGRANRFDVDEGVLIATERSPEGNPITQVARIARNKHAEYQSQLIELNESLKSKVIASSFGARTRRRKVVITSQINAVEAKLLTRMAEWKTTEPEDVKSVKTYFQRFRSITERLEKSTSPDKLFLNEFFSDEMQRITALSDALDEFDEQSTTFEKPIKHYLECLNNFLKDSGKALKFNEKTNALFFHSLNNKTEANQSVGTMSSGERQLLILLTYIAFPPKDNNAFVIDEPELSLHPKWQHQFLPAVEQLMHRDAQLIIATHSPEIVGRYKRHCVQM